MSSAHTHDRQMKKIKQLRRFVWLESYSPISPFRVVSLGTTFGALLVMTIQVEVAIQVGLLELTRSLGGALVMGVVATLLGQIVAWVMEPLSWRGYAYRTLREVMPQDNDAFLSLLDDLARDGYAGERLGGWLKQEMASLKKAQRAADERRQLLEKEQVSEAGQFRQLLARRQTLR